MPIPLYPTRKSDENPFIYDMSMISRFGKCLFCNSQFSSYFSPFSSADPYNSFVQPLQFQKPIHLLSSNYRPYQYIQYEEDDSRFFHSYDADHVEKSGFPQPIDKFMNDFGSIISEEDSRFIKQELVEIYKETGIEITVVTIPSINDYSVGVDPIDQTIETFSTSLFNTWGIGSKDENDGILLLVALNDRQIRIEIGSGWSTYFNGQMEKVIYRDVVPYFKRGDFSGGVVEGVKGIIEAVTVEDGFSSRGWNKFFVWGFRFFCAFLIFQLIRRFFFKKKARNVVKEKEEGIVSQSRSSKGVLREKMHEKTSRVGNVFFWRWFVGVWRYCRDFLMEIYSMLFGDQKESSRVFLEYNKDSTRNRKKDKIEGKQRSEKKSSSVPLVIPITKSRPRNSSRSSRTPSSSRSSSFRSPSGGSRSFGGGRSQGGGGSGRW